MVKLKKKKVRLLRAGDKPPADQLGPTERRWMPHKQKDQMFAMLGVMAEKNNAAFDILMEFFTIGADPLFHEMVTKLDDMNIRGEQICIAFDYCERNITVFVSAIRKRDKGMIEKINSLWKKAFMEQAVKRGAHKWMHKKIITPPV